MSKSKTKRLLSMTLTFLFCLSVFACIPFTASASDAVIGFKDATIVDAFTGEVNGITAENVDTNQNGATQNQLNIAARGDYMYSLQWTCLKNISAHSYSSYYTFYAGNTYRVPYGQGSVSYYVGYGVTPENFLKAAADINSVFYTSKSYSGTWYSAYYITDCSGFVSYSLGLSAKQSTRTLANYTTYIASVTSSNIYNYLQIGDIINRYDYHVVLVTDLIYDSAGTLTGVEITESTIPQIKRTVYTPSYLASLYSSYDGIYRYTGSVPSAPNQNKWVTSGSHKMYQYGNGTYAYGWAYIDNAWYFFDGNGYMLTGWVYDGTAWYYLDPTYGYMWVNSWIQDENGDWYHVGSDGKMQKGWILDGETWYYLSPSNGMMQKGWLLDGDTWYYLGSYSGAMWTGWNSIDGKWVELSSTGVYYRTIEPIGDGFKAKIVTNADKNKALSLCGNNVELRTDDNGADQWWTFSLQSDGSYKIFNCSTGWCMDVQDAGVENGTNVQTWSDNGADAQKWVITLDEGCTGYTFRPVNAINNGKVMDVINADTSDGSNIVLSTSHLGSNQQFTLIMEGDENTSVDDTSSSVDPSTSEEPSTSDSNTSETPKLELKDDSAYSILEQTVYNVQADTLSEDFAGNFKYSVTIVNLNGIVTELTDKIGTGFVVSVPEAEEIATVVVLGDVNGDGELSSTDYLRIKAFFLGSTTLEGVYYVAANVDGEGEIDSTDYLRLKAHFLGSINIYE